MSKNQIPFKQGVFHHKHIIANVLKLSVCLPVLVLAACSDHSSGDRATISSNNAENTKKQVGLLLPLSGRNGVLGNNMLHAAQLALGEPSSPKLNVYDTEQPGGSAEAARKAVAAGDGIILGPLTASNTTEVASVTTSSNVPVLAYTSDISVVGPNVWALGLTPEQQVMTMVKAAQKQGKTKFAALLPDNAFGRAMAAGLTKTCSDLGLQVPSIAYHTKDSQDITAQLKTLSNYDSRLTAAGTNGSSSTTGQETASTTADSNSDNLLDQLDPSVSQQTKKETSSNVALGDPPFDVLLLADTGLQLQSVIDAMNVAQISSKKTLIMGPALWSAFAGKLGKLQGAWYAAPNPEKRQGFVRQYTAKYGQAPKNISDFAYDSAALANSLSKIGGYTQSNLTRADGFDGVDGLFILKPDGHVERHLQIFEIQPVGGAKMIFPAGSTTPHTSPVVTPKTNS